MATDEAAYHGTWMIVECVSLAGTVEATGIEGTIFHLDESGDVTWKVSEDAEPMPFFTCETYEISSSSSDDACSLKFFGTYAGHVIEFRVEVQDDLMLLTYDGCCMLQCQKTAANDPRNDVPFSFLGAMEEGYFTDLTIRAQTLKEYKVHTTILSLGTPGLDWSASPPPLSGLREDVLETILHYLYAESLPPGLSEDTAKACTKSLSKMPEFTKFTELCETFLKNTVLKQQIISLVTDMHTCGDKMIELFSGKSSESPRMLDDEGLMANPSRLCYVVKQALREGAVACAKLLILCDLFSRRKGDLSREERHEIIKYAKSRLPIFMNQLHKFLEVCKYHTANLTAVQRHELATYLVPEIETTLDTISKFAVDTKTALEQVISISSNSDKNAEKSSGEHEGKHKKGHVREMLVKTLKTALHMRELKKLKIFHERTTASFVHLMVKKENFSLMTQGEKIRSVSRNLEQLVDEVPLFLVRIEELKIALDEKVTWREWKYLFKLGTSKVAWGLSKVLANKSTLLTMIRQICDIVHRDQFSTSLASLGLSPSEADAENNSGASAKPSMQTKYAQLSSVESLCVPPYASDCLMAKNALELFRKGENTDVTFEIVLAHDVGDVVIDHTHGEPVTTSEPERDVEVHEIHAHRVIIAARCNWFRRALLSGMRESIDKKIVIHDTNPELMRLFLVYLYCGQLDAGDLTTDQLADMMTLGDRYEVDSLKSLCERLLERKVDEETALYLLSLSDQLNAGALREASLQYISCHRDVYESDVFDDLPAHLQAEVEEAITWDSLAPRSRNLSGHSHTETPSSSVSEIDELINNLELAERRDLSTSSSSEDLRYVEDSTRLESCVDALRGIIGDSVPREELVRYSLAADYDVNRALNFFFSA